MGKNQAILKRWVIMESTRINPKSYRGDYLSRPIYLPNSSPFVTSSSGKCLTSTRSNILDIKWALIFAPALESEGRELTNSVVGGIAPMANINLLFFNGSVPRLVFKETAVPLAKLIFSTKQRRSIDNVPSPWELHSSNNRSTVEKVSFRLLLSLYESARGAGTIL